MFFTVEYVTPVFAKNFQGSWRYVVQIPYEGYFTQTVEVTRCLQTKCHYLGEWRFPTAWTVTAWFVSKQMAVAWAHLDGCHFSLLKSSIQTQSKNIKQARHRHFKTFKSIRNTSKSELVLRPTTPRSTPRRRRHRSATVTMRSGAFRSVFTTTGFWFRAHANAGDRIISQNTWRSDQSRLNCKLH